MTGGKPLFYVSQSDEMKKLFFLFMLIVSFAATCFAQPEQTKWTAVWSQNQFYGGIATDLAPITLQGFGVIDSLWLESLVAFKLFNIEKTPLFTGLGVHFRFKSTDTGFNGGFTIGWGWAQETQKINFYLAGTIRF